MEPTQQDYAALLERKIKVTQKVGVSIHPDELHPSALPHQVEAILWACETGRGLIALNCGRGKSHIQIEVSRLLQKHEGGKCLIVTELGVMQEFTDPDRGEGARLGVKMEYVEDQAQADASTCDIVLTNYERIRLGRFDFSRFTAVSCDEGSYLKNMASDTTSMLQSELQKAKYRFIATATPAPNEKLEIINYAHVLGLWDRGGILTRFFQRNSTSAGDLTIHPNHEDDFWMWVYGWSIWDSEDEGAGLPELRIHWILADDGAGKVHVDRDGQAKLIKDGGASLPEAAALKRESTDTRIAKAMEIVGQAPDLNYVIWHHLEDERKALAKAFAGHASYGDVFGSQKRDIRDKRIFDFSTGFLQILATKPEISGVGCNFQRHCHTEIFLGINDSFEEWYQAYCRCWRYPQDKAVDVYMIYTSGEDRIRQNLERKLAEHRDTRTKMRDLIRRFGLNQAAFVEEKRRSMFTDRQQWTGRNWTLYNNDSVDEMARLPDDSADMILTSIPFGNHYEYSDRLQDFGHNEDNAAFFRQMDYLVPHLLRILKPGRIAAIHTKNRIHYGSVTGNGFSTFHRFTHAACDCFEKHGFHTMGFHYVPTDVVLENNQTYRLAFGEMQKDATKMGAGIPEEIWIFRKAPTSSANAYADVPVRKNHLRCPYCAHEDIPAEFVPPKAGRNGFALRCRKCKQYLHAGELITPPVDEMERDYSLARWQLDADAHWRSSGDRPLTPEELSTWTLEQLRAWWDKTNSEDLYDLEAHHALLKTLDNAGRLSKTFTTLPLRSNTGFVWNDVNRMQCLNAEQKRRNLRNHICPMPFDEVRRLIHLYTNPSELIVDPFGGVGTTGVVAVQEGRKAYLGDLNETYALTARMYLMETEKKKSMPSLLDMLGVDWNNQ